MEPSASLSASCLCQFDTMSTHFGLFTFLLKEMFAGSAKMSLQKLEVVQAQALTFCCGGVKTITARGGGGCASETQT